MLPRLELGPQQNIYIYIYICLPGEWKTKGPQKSNNKKQQGERILGKGPWLVEDSFQQMEVLRCPPIQPGFGRPRRPDLDQLSAECAPSSGPPLGSRSSPLGRARYLESPSEPEKKKSMTGFAFSHEQPPLKRASAPGGLLIYPRNSGKKQKKHGVHDPFILGNDQPFSKGRKETLVVFGVSRSVCLALPMSS